VAEPSAVAPHPTLTRVSADGELRLAIRESIRTLNPYGVGNSSEAFVVALLYDTLLSYDWQSGLRPNIAERWELAPDGASLSFWLNPQSQWHDGQPLTAGDVVFSFNLVSRNSFPGMTWLASIVDRVEAVSAHEVKFALLGKAADATRWLATRLYIVPAHLWGAVHDPLQYVNLDRPVGSGPFALAEHVPGKRLVLANTLVHAAGSPQVARVVLEFIPDEDKALQALKDGKMDALGWDVSAQLASEVKKQAEGVAELRWMETSGVYTHALLLNLRTAPYSSRDFREALAQALDTQAIAQSVLLGFADASTPGLFPPSSQWRNPGIASMGTAPQSAVKLLDGAGFVDVNGDGARENADGSALQIELLCAKEPTALSVADAIVSQWRAVGINTKVRSVAQDALLPALMQAQFEVALHSVTLEEPEMAFFYLHSSRGLVKEGRVTGLNFGGFASARYDELAAASLEEQDTDRRRQLLYDLQTELAADLPIIPLYLPHVLNLYREDRFIGWTGQPGTGLLSRATIAGLLPR
jgi:peptide/nickel transport system substrate-binding protein